MNDHYDLGDLSATAGFPDLTCGASGTSCGLASATFYDGSAGGFDGPPGRYYTIPDFTDDLWEVSFSAAPGEPGVVIDTVTKIADLTGNARCWQFGDIAVDFGTGILYGSGRVGATCLPDPEPAQGTEVEFFSYDLTGPGPFTMIKTEAVATYPLVQLTFNTPYDTLYAFNSDIPTATGEVFVVDLGSGAYTPMGFPSPVVLFRDVGGARPGTFTPVQLMDFTVTDE